MTMELVCLESKLTEVEHKQERHRRRTKVNLENFAGAWAGCALLVTLGVSLIMPSLGRNPQEHIGPVPAGVISQSPTQFVITDKAQASVTADTLCGDIDYAGDDSSVLSEIKMGDQAAVTCKYPQTWYADAATKPNPDSFSEVMVSTATSPYYLSVGLLGTFFPLTIIGAGFVPKHRRLKSQQQDLKIQLEAAKSLVQDGLTQAFVQGKITQDQYEEKLQALVLRNVADDEETEGVEEDYGLDSESHWKQTHKTSEGRTSAQQPVPSPDDFSAYVGFLQQLARQRAQRRDLDCCQKVTLAYNQGAVAYNQALADLQSL